MTEIIQPGQEVFQLEENQNRQMIIAIKKARVEKHLSYQAIVDGCEKNGDFVSMSTVRRVCAEGSENHRFRYEATLRPIARFVLGLDTDVPAAEAATEDGPAANELLRVVVGIKEDTIAEMRQDLESHEAEMDKIKQESAVRIEEKDLELKYLKNEVASMRRAIITQTIIIILLVVALVLH